MEKLKQAAGTPDSSDGKGSPTDLSLAFGPESSLPSKANLVRTYFKFGILNKAETRCRGSLQSFTHTNSFKAASMTFDLQYPSTQLKKTRELRELALPRASPP